MEENAWILRACCWALAGLTILIVVSFRGAPLLDILNALILAGAGALWTTLVMLLNQPRRE